MIGGNIGGEGAKAMSEGLKVNSTLTAVSFTREKKGERTKEKE